MFLWSPQCPSLAQLLSIRSALTQSTRLGAIQHKSPLFQTLERCPVWWRLTGESSTVATFGVTVHCVRMALKCSAFLQRSKVLFPARGPVFSSPAWAPHNWDLCSLWSFSPFSIFCRAAAVALLRVGWQEFIWLHKARPYLLVKLLWSFLLELLLDSIIAFVLAAVFRRCLSNTRVDFYLRWDVRKVYWKMKPS